MKKREANAKIKEIKRLAEEIELDSELIKIDIRYSIMASWIDTDIENCDG